jgi:polar amino acid transport system substrate-binding protein
MASKQVVIVLSTSGIKSLSELEGRNIGLQLASSSESALRNNPRFEETVSSIKKYDTLLFTMSNLDIGNVDAVIVDEVIALYGYLLKHPEKYYLLSEPLSNERFTVGFRKNDIALRDKINSVLSDIISDGTIAEIADKWLIDKTAIIQ